MALKALIFDFDGTILDTETPEYRLVGTLYQNHGHGLTVERWQQGIGTAGVWDPWAPFRDHPSFAEIKAAHRTELLAAIDALDAREGVRGTLAEARAAGLRLAVASSSDRAWIDRHLNRLGLTAFFDAVVAKEDVPRVKPDPALYRLALARLDVNPHEAIAIEDSLNGLRAALAANLVCVVTPNEITATMPFPPDTPRLDSLAGGLAALRDLMPR